MLPSSFRCVSRARSVVIWGSFVLAVLGWATAGGVWIGMGVEAGIRPSFILGLTVACTFTVTCSHAIVMPDKVKLYGIGFRDGVIHEAEQHHAPDPQQPRRHLSVAP